MLHLELSELPQQAIYSVAGVAKQKAKQKVDSKIFAAGVKADSLYAAFASYRERGDRSYWLLRTKSAAEPVKGPIKVAGGTTIRTGTWVVEAQWYLSTSDDQGRKSYKLLPDLVQVPIVSLVQEHGLEWAHEGRSGGQSILSAEYHLALMSHNYSNLR